MCWTISIFCKFIYLAHVMDSLLASALQKKICKALHYKALHMGYKPIAETSSLSGF